MAAPIISLSCDGIECTARFGMWKWLGKSGWEKSLQFLKRGLTMGKGKSSSAPQQTEVKQTTTNLPEYAAPYFTRLLGRTEYESLNPYRTYTGQRLAERSPLAEQVAARQTALGLAGAPREMAEASQLARTSVVNPQRFDSGIASMYMNPFQRLVTRS